MQDVDDVTHILQVCSVVMPAQVQLRVGDSLQFQPKEGQQPVEPESEWAELCKSSVGKLARIFRMKYERRSDIPVPLDAATMYIDFSRLILRVKFQDEEMLRNIPAIHFENPAPRASPF